ncbi:MAG: N-glycosylase/DNA lyase [Candidatus Micrarchaeota archaeon]
MKKLLGKYRLKKGEISSRMEDFARVGQLGENALLGEAAFCISAANSSAKAAFRAQEELARSGLIYSNEPEHVAQVLLKAGVRFHNHKAEYIVEARKHLFEGKNLERYLEEHKNEFELRNCLAKEVKGFGMKEASHFLRNTGLGSEIAILDRHILKNLQKYGAIEELPKSMSAKKYLEIEQKMLEFSKGIKIPMPHLDLLFWSEQTGEIFK